MLGDLKHMIVIRLRLIHGREAAGLSQGKAAELLGVHRPTLSYIEAGNQRLTVEMLLKLCDLYGLNVSAVLWESDDAWIGGIPEHGRYRLRR